MPAPQPSAFGIRLNALAPSAGHNKAACRFHRLAIVIIGGGGGVGEVEATFIIAANSHTHTHTLVALGERPSVALSETLTRLTGKAGRRLANKTPTERVNGFASARVGQSLNEIIQLLTKLLSAKPIEISS